MEYLEKMMDRILYFACLITRSDYDLAIESNRMDRLTIISQAVTLIVLTCAATLAWSAFWSSFLSPWVGILLGLLVATHIFLLDQAMGASDWELAGILKQPAPGVARNGGINFNWWGKFALRVGISLILAQATAVGLTLWMFRGAIDNHLQDKRAVTNSTVEQEYAGRKEELKARIVEPLEEEIGLLSEESNTLLASVKDANEKRADATKRASTARIEADREHEGGLKNYYKGDGPLFREARRQEREANRLSETLTTEVNAAKGNLKDINAQLEAKRKELAAANDKFKAESLEIDKQKLADSRWAHEKIDPLTRYIGLHELKNSPKYGAATREFSRLMNMLLVTLELIFLAIKIVFAPASVYQVRLIARTKLEAAGVSARFARGMDENNRNRPRGGLRVVGGANEDANRQQQEENAQREQQDEQRRQNEGR